MGMSKEEFLNKWMDTHTEFTLQDKLGSSNGSLIKKSDGDKNIDYRKKIPGKNIIEAKAIEKRDETFREYLDDAITVRNKEILDIDFEKLLALRVKTMVQRIEQKTEAVHSFADMVKMVKLEAHKIVDVPQAQDLPSSTDLPESTDEDEELDA